MNKDYVKGFIDKCASRGVDPEVLKSKLAQESAYYQQNSARLFPGSDNAPAPVELPPPPPPLPPKRRLRAPRLPAPLAAGGTQQDQAVPLGGYNAVTGPTLGAQIAARPSPFTPTQPPAPAPNSTSKSNKNLTATPMSLAARDNAKIRAKGMTGGPYS